MIEVGIRREQGRKASQRWRDKQPPATPDARAKNRAYAKDYWAKNKDKYNAARRNISPEERAVRQRGQRDWARKNPIQKLLTGAKTRAKKRGMEFSVTLEDLLPLPVTCPVLNIPLRPGQGTNDPNGYSLDRVDNDKGYVKGNVVIMSRRANVLKSDATPEEIHALANWLTLFQAEKGTRHG